MLIGERTMSSVKKKGGGVRGQFVRMHLGVYPTQLEFFSNVDFRTAFYFQKNYQLLGQIQEIIPETQKNTKLPLSNIKNVIHFRLYDPSNIVYRWSVYRRNDKDQEEQIDSCSLNLKEAVNSYLAPIKNHSHHSAASIIELGFMQKQMRLKFPKIGVVLTFILFVAQDQEQMREYVQRRLINKEEDGIIENTFIRNDSNSINNTIGLTSRRNASGIARKSSDPLGELIFSNTNKPSEQFSTQSKKDDKDVNKKSTSQNLQNLIFSFDATGTLAEAVSLKLENLKIDSKEDEGKEGEDDDLVFHEEKPSSHEEPPKGDYNDFLDVGKSSRKEEKQIEKRDYSMLKLDSDQGRVKQDPLDNKLEQLQLENIEQVEPSRQCTISMYPLQHVNPLKNRAERLRGQKGPSLQQIKELQTELRPPQSTTKKMVIILIFSLLLFAAAAVMLQHNKKKRGKRIRSKK